MSTNLLECENCHATMPIEVVNAAGPQTCPACRMPVKLAVFPAVLKRDLRGRPGEPLRDDTESSCFNHPGMRAEVPCEGCGRFLCATCDVELGGKHFCPDCYANGINAQEGKAEGERRRYDRLVLLLALAPILIWPLTLITAPCTLALSIFAWRRSPDLGKEIRVRIFIGAFIATLELLGWAALLGMLLMELY
jgi:hypothetical protein